MTPAFTAAGLFAERARRLAGEVAVGLGWRPDEFWRATPAELAGILETMVPASGEPVDLVSLMNMFPDGEAPPPRFAHRSRSEPASLLRCAPGTSLFAAAPPSPSELEED